MDYREQGEALEMAADKYFGILGEIERVRHERDDLLAACKAVWEWAYASTLTEQGTIGYFGEFVVPMVDEAIKKVEGE